MVKRTVSFTATADGGVTPAIPVFGGVKGEHHATALTVTLASGVYTDGDLVRLSFTTGDGTVLSSDLLEDFTVTDNGGIRVTYSLPQLLTVAAGQLCVRVVLSRMENDNECNTWRSGEMVLYFDHADIENGTPFWTGVSEMLARTAAAKDAAVISALNSRNDSIKASAAASDAQGFSEEAAASAKAAAKAAAGAGAGTGGGQNGESGVYVGSGDPPEGYDFQIDPEGDVLELGDGLKIVGNKLCVDMPSGGGGSVDLSNYATKKDVENAIAGIDIPTGGGFEWKKVFAFTTEEEVSVLHIDVADIVEQIRNATFMRIKFTGAKVLNTEDISSTASGTFQWISGDVIRNWITNVKFLPTDTDSTSSLYISMDNTMGGSRLFNYYASNKHNNTTKTNETWVFGWTDSPTQEFVITATDTAIGAGSTFEIWIV